MRRTPSLTLIVLAALLSTACAHPLSSLRSDLEGRDAFVAQYWPPQTDSSVCQAGIDVLESAAAARRVTVIYADIPNEIGIANWTEQSVTVHRPLTACGRLEVLAHELAHLAQPKGLTVPEAQVFADGVGYLVVRKLAGYDPKTRYSVFLATYKASGRVLDLYRREIEAVAAKLTEAR